MDLKKSGVKKADHTLQDSGLFGIIENATTTNPTKKTTVDFPVPLNYEARKKALAPIVRAEYWKAQAITLIRQNSRM